MLIFLKFQLRFYYSLGKGNRGFCTLLLFTGFANTNSIEYLSVRAVFLNLIKTVDWQWMNKDSLMREIKRLGIQIAEMNRLLRRRPNLTPEFLNV